MPQNAWLVAVYEEFRRELFVTAWSVLRRTDLAEDAIQEAFARMVELTKPPLEPKLYVFRSVRNAAIDLVRARSRRREAPLEQDWDAPDRAREDASAELTQAVADSLARLDAASRELIELHLHASLTFQEIGELLGEPLPTVASRYRRALEKLGQQLKVRHE